MQTDVPGWQTLRNSERAAAELAITGLSNKEIAERLGTTENTIKNYLREVYDKLGVWSRGELAIKVLTRRARN